MPTEDNAPWRRHLRPALKDLTVYDVPSSEGMARLNANECPEPWPSEVMQALADVVRGLNLSRYPDPTGRPLRRVLANHHGCDPDRVVLGNGSDEIIGFLLTALAGSPSETKSVVVPEPTFTLYGHLATVLGLSVRSAPLTSDLQLDPTALSAALSSPDVALCFLARPNNPTGSLFDADFIHDLVRRFPQVVFVIDEAYVAYAPGQSLWKPGNPSNMVHMATLSKVGLAGLRVGYCIASPDLALALHKVRPPYNLSLTSLAIAETILTRFGHIQADMVEKTIANRERLAELLARIHSAKVLPSSGNLVLVRLPTAHDARQVCRHFADHRILVKDVSAVRGLEGCIRVSVGSGAELDQLEQAIAALA